MDNCKNCKGNNFFIVDEVLCFASFDEQGRLVINEEITQTVREIRCVQCRSTLDPKQIEILWFGFGSASQRQTLENAPADVHFSSAPSNKGTVSK